MTFSGFLPTSASHRFPPVRASVGTRRLGKAVRRRSPTCHGSSSRRPVAFGVDMRLHPLPYDGNDAVSLPRSNVIHALAMSQSRLREFSHWGAACASVDSVHLRG